LTSEDCDVVVGIVNVWVVADEDEHKMQAATRTRSIPLWG